MNHPLGTASADWRERLAERTGDFEWGAHPHPPELQGTEGARQGAERPRGLEAGPHPTPCGCCGGSGIWWASLDETVTVVCVDCDGTGIEGEDR
jgi:hypothetical protein